MTMLVKYSVFSLITVIGLIACSPHKESIEQQEGVASCEPNMPCTFNKGIKVWLPDTDLTPETPFNINLSVANNEKIISARLEGVTMYMGYIPVAFSSLGNIYQAQTMVGICSEKNMKWKLQLNLEDKHGNPQTLSYYFIVTY